MPISLPTTDRNFRGYAGKPPPVRWPHEARLAVSVVVNVEEGAELSLAMGDERNEAIYEVKDLVASIARGKKSVREVDPRSCNELVKARVVRV